MGLSEAERELLDSFVAEEKPTITAADVEALREVSRPAANRILARLAEKGWLQRIKRGLYAPVQLGMGPAGSVIEEPWPLAMKLFAPCQISGWSAAEHWDLTEQIFNTISVLSGEPQRRSDQHYAGIDFHVRSIDPSKLFGAQAVWIGSSRVSVADPSKMLIDILDAPAFGGGARHTIDVIEAYWKSKHADPDRLLDYAKRFGRGTVFKRLGFTAERSADVSPQWLVECRENISAGVSNFDPAGSDQGKIVSRWNLRVNVPIAGDA